MNRLDKAIFYVSDWENTRVKETLKCFSKGMKVVAGSHYRDVVEDFPDLKITVK